MTGPDVAAARAFLEAEGALLDDRLWDEWLALYTEDAVFWVPAWTSEETPTSDPLTEVSLIYHDRRERLAERVWRVRSGLSLASSPLQRTAHMVSGVRIVDEAQDGSTRVRSTWTVHRYDPRRKIQNAFFGRAEHRLVRIDGAWRIAAKTVWLLNDLIPTVLDFYMI